MIDTEQLLELARNAGFKVRHNSTREWWMLTEDIERFAALIAAHEREECAKLVSDSFLAQLSPYYANETIAAIRARKDQL